MIVIQAKTVNRIVRISTVTAICLSVFLLTFSLCRSYDSFPGYFTEGAVIPVLWEVLIFAYPALLLVLCLFVARKGIYSCGPEELSGKPSGSWMVALFVCVAIYIASLCRTLVSGSMNWFALLSVVTSIPVIVAAVLSVLPNRADRAKDRLTASIFGVVTLALQAGMTYMNVSVPMNAPLKILHLMATLLSMAYITCEARYYLANGTARPRLTILTAAVSTLLNATYALSCLLASLLQKALLEDVSLVNILICLCLFIYEFVRLFSLTSGRSVIDS